VTVRPATALLVRMPATKVRLRLLRRKAERDVTVTYGTLQRACDVLVCEGCNARPVTTPILCDDRVHLLCESCLWTCPACQARTCLACDQRCRRCRHPTARAHVAASQPPPPAPTAPRPVQASPDRPAATGGKTANARVRQAKVEPAPSVAAQGEGGNGGTASLPEASSPPEAVSVRGRAALDDLAERLRQHLGSGEEPRRSR
jgi:hypothetical protein